jgi:pilus assembly protein Flp/PilA
VAAVPEREGSLYLQTFWRDEQGQGMVEYALIIIVVAIAIIFMLVIMQDQLKNFFSNVGNNLT